jgi:2'-5' RNA ligase
MDNSQEKSSYLLLVEPEKKVSFRIEKLRDTIHSEVNMVSNPFFTPSISVLDYFQHESYEARMLPQLKKFFAQIQPFTLQLADFGHFPDSFFIKVKPTPKELQRLSSRKNALISITRTTVNFPPLYHVPVFKDLSPEMEASIWEKWKQNHFEDLFTVKEFIFMRKRDHQRHYQELARFPLLGKEIKPKFVQGRLFE